MAIKRTNGNGANGNAGTDTAESSAPAITNDPQKFRENAEVNSKIDTYIQKNPKEWSYIQAMPRERLERSLVLQSVQKEERKEKMRASILKKLDEAKSNVTRTAELLGLERSHLYRKMKALGIAPKE